MESADASNCDMVMLEKLESQVCRVFIGTTVFEQLVHQTVKQVILWYMFI